ncbi:MAG: hypothetical protein EXR71_02935 [Myxococcales bacterium]|nr:hypothetical protein [Myxococcales bacterium]
MIALIVGVALACQDAVFRTLDAPPIPRSGKASVTGDSTIDGARVIGARFTMVSDVPVAAWRSALSNPERQDDWVPERFGYDLVEKVDDTHMYLQVNVGFLFGAVNIRRQLVAELASQDTGSRFVTCWRRVNPDPYRAQLGAMVSDATWQDPSAGWWSVEPAGSQTVVGYQWWTLAAGLPTAVVKFGATQTLPDLMDAFEAQARRLAKAG